MPVMTYRDALNEVMHQEMECDPTVFVCGEDISGGAGGTSGEREALRRYLRRHEWPVAKIRRRPCDRYADFRKYDCRSGRGRVACWQARYRREIMFADFLGLALDQAMNQAAKFRYMSGGKAKCPVVIRVPYGAGMNMAAQHSQTMYQIMTSVPGLKVVMPATPADAKGLLTTAIRDDDPVVFFEHKAMYGRKGEVPEGEYLIPFGQAAVVNEGDDATVIAMGRMVNFGEKAVEGLKEEGINCDLIDLRTTSPLDEDTILDSVEKTGRVVVVDECPPRCSLASDIAGFIASPRVFIAEGASAAGYSAPMRRCPSRRILSAPMCPVRRISTPLSEKSFPTNRQSSHVR